MFSVYGELVGLSTAFIVAFFLKSGNFSENDVKYRYNSGILGMEM